MVLYVNEEEETQELVSLHTVVTGDHLAVSGDHGRAVSGTGGRSIAGDQGCAISDEDGYSRTGADGYSLAGSRGIAISGARGMSIAGVGGVVKSGPHGLLVLSNIDENGSRFVVAADINEETGLLANTFYRLDGHAFVVALIVDEVALEVRDAS
jgi:hypothetical protein